MKRWLLITAAAILTLGAFVSFNAPAMAREFHAHEVHAVSGHHGTWRHIVTHRASHVRVTHGHAAHFHRSKHVAHRR
jgi:hypothetical protein